MKHQIHLTDEVGTLNPNCPDCQAMVAISISHDSEDNNFVPSEKMRKSVIESLIAKAKADDDAKPSYQALAAYNWLRAELDKLENK